MTVHRVMALCGDRWTDGGARTWAPVYNPSTGEVIAEVPMAEADAVEPVVAAASRAFTAWSQKPVVERARIMFGFHRQIDSHFDDLAELVTREHGKTFGEARASVQRGLEMVEFACAVPSLAMGNALPDIARDVDCETVREPLGVCVGITPFNFPAMVPLWMFPLAITCGNTFILKPSEKVPMTAVRLGELLMEAGLPEGVFNILHGGRPVVEALISHPQVRAVSFVGSTNVARAVHRLAIENGKRVQAAGGAKNHIVIMPDADIEQAASAVQAAAFGCAGERCMAASVAVPAEPVADAFVEALRNSASKMAVGETAERQDVDMGPVITREHRERIETYIDVARDEGATVALDGRQVDYGGNGYIIGPSIVDHVGPDMRVFREEIFGPLLSVVRARDFDDVIDLGRHCNFGNGASIFTRDGYIARQFKRHFNAGMIGINVGVPAPMAWFPFTGRNQSFFGDLHLQGEEGVGFYTQQRMTLTRWFAPSDHSHADTVWKTGRHH